jgi:hypothetical protein
MRKNLGKKNSKIYPVPPRLSRYSGFCIDLLDAISKVIIIHIFLQILSCKGISQNCFGDLSERGFLRLSFFTMQF